MSAFTKLNNLLKQAAIKAPHLFYTSPILIGCTAFYLYKRAYLLSIPPETIAPFRGYYYVMRPQDVSITDDSASAYNWDDLRQYSQHFPNLHSVPNPPQEPSLLPPRPYPRVGNELLPMTDEQLQQPQL